MRRWLATADRFPPGRVPLLLLCFALATGAAVAWRSAQEQRQLEIWTFTHFASTEFTPLIAARPDADEIRVVNLGAAMFDRLALALMTRTELPGLVEIEQQFVGRYTRGPVADIPFVDLTQRVRREGWDEKLIAARLARYTVNGHIFGIPHDIHPMVLLYRPDVLAELGYQPEDLATWEAFCAAAQKFYRPGRLGTTEWRRGIALQAAECHDFLALLWQRGGDVFDPEGRVIIDSDLAVDTLTFFKRLFKSDPPVAGPKLTGWSEDFAALARGQILAYPAPDWMLAGMQLEQRDILEGKVRIMPLPAWQAGGRRTSTGGGSAMFIPLGSADPDRCWELLKQLYFDRESLVQRFRTQSIVPPLRTVYDDPVFDAPVVFFQGQRIGRLLTELAGEVPPINGSPYLPDAYKRLDVAVDAVLREAQTPAAALRSVAADLRAIIKRDAYLMQAAGSQDDQRK